MGAMLGHSAGPLAARPLKGRSVAVIVCPPYRRCRKDEHLQGLLGSPGARVAGLADEPAEASGQYIGTLRWAVGAKACPLWLMVSGPWVGTIVSGPCGSVLGS